MSSERGSGEAMTRGEEGRAEPELDQSQLSELDQSQFVEPWSGTTERTSAFPSEEKRSSLAGAIVNLFMTSIGAGVLTLPFAVDQSGLVLGVTWLVLFSVLAVYTLEMLTACSLSAGAVSYGDVMQHFLGGRGRSLANLLLMVYAFGGGVSFMMILATEFRTVIHAWAGAPRHRWEQQRDFLLPVMVALSVLPLSMLKSMTRFKHTSALGCFAALYICAVVVIMAPWEGAGYHTCGNASSLDHDHAKKDKQIKLWPTAFMELSSALPLFSFAYNSAWAYVPVLNTLSEPTPGKATKLILSANTLVTINYVAMGTVGYTSFCGAIKDNILDNLPVTASVVIARVALVVQLLFALPIRFNVCRRILFEFLDAKHKDKETRAPAPSKTTHVLVTFVIVGLCTLVACLVNSLHTAIGLTSSICASCIVYILPGICYLKLQSKQQRRGSYRNLTAPLLEEPLDHAPPPSPLRKFFMNIPCYFTIFVGWYCLVMGTFANIYNAVH